MNVLILGGNSKRHYEWVRSVGAFLEDTGHTAIIHDYKHWSSGEPIADIEHEISVLADKMSEVEDYAVVAKSIGTIISVLAVARGDLRPTMSVLLGIPYLGIASETPEFELSLPKLPKTIIIQNQNDPYGSADYVHDRLQAVPMQQVNFIALPNNDTHDYLDFDFIERQLKA